MNISVHGASHEYHDDAYEHWLVGLALCDNANFVLIFESLICVLKLKHQSKSSTQNKNSSFHHSLAPMIYRLIKYP